MTTAHDLVSTADLDMVIDIPQSAIADAMIGKAIGHYIVRRKLAEGGMGLVYVAEHPAIGKRVALKVLHPEFSSQAEPYVGPLARREAPVEIRLTLPGYVAATRNVAGSADVALSVSLDRAPQGASPSTPGDTRSPR